MSGTVWYYLGGLAYLSSITGLILAIMAKTKGSRIMLFCSLALAAIVALERLIVIVTGYSSLASSYDILKTLQYGNLILVAINVISWIIADSKIKE